MVFYRSYSYEDVTDDDPYSEMISHRASLKAAAAMDDSDAAVRKSRRYDDLFMRNINSRLDDIELDGIETSKLSKKRNSFRKLIEKRSKPLETVYNYNYQYENVSDVYKPRQSRKTRADECKTVRERILEKANIISKGAAADGRSRPMVSGNYQLGLMGLERDVHNSRGKYATSWNPEAVVLKSRSIQRRELSPEYQPHRLMAKSTGTRSTLSFGEDSGISLAQHSARVRAYEVTSRPRALLGQLYETISGNYSRIDDLLKRPVRRSPPPSITHEDDEISRPRPIYYVAVPADMGDPITVEKMMTPIKVTGSTSDDWIEKKIDRGYRLLDKDMDDYYHTPIADRIEIKAALKGQKAVAKASSSARPMSRIQDYWHEKPLGNIDTLKEQPTLHTNTIEIQIPSHTRVLEISRQTDFGVTDDNGGRKLHDEVDEGDEVEKAEEVDIPEEMKNDCLNIKPPEIEEEKH